MIAEIITIGDELLRGEIIDSNKARIAEQLLLLDLDCRYQVSVLDDPADMQDAFRRAAGRSDFVLISGGLGPTRDDLTTEVVAQTFGREMKLHEESLAVIEGFFRSVGREMSDVNRKQAYFPVGADVLKNSIGTAPGFSIREGRAMFFAMPGVPRELDLMMDDEVLPRITSALLPEEGPQASFSPEEGPQALSEGEALQVGGGLERRVVRAVMLRTFGMGESTLEAELLDLAREGEVDLGYRTSFPDNFLRPVARAKTAEEADARIAEVSAAIRDRLGAIVYGEGDDTMEIVVGRLLTEKRLTVATAESCTGGLIAERLTDVPGSSTYFLGGVVAYSNAVKASMLGVPEAVLEEHGAVSEPVVRAMAEGVRKRLGSDFGIATSGISGPSGGTEDKPVGLVWLALAMPAQGAAKSSADAQAETHAESFVFKVSRSGHRSLTSQVALDWIRRSLLGIELVGPSLMRRAGGRSNPSGSLA